MRKTNYVCDICGSDIKSHCRAVQGSLTQSKKCHYELVFKEMAHGMLANEPIYEKHCDVCDKCQKSIMDLLHEIKTNATKSLNEQKQIDLFEEIKKGEL